MDMGKVEAFREAVVKWCIYAVVIAAPFSKSISEIAISLAIVLWVLKMISDRKFKLPETALTIPFLIFIAAILPSFFNSEFLNLSIKAFFTKNLKYIAFYFVIVDTMDTKEKLKDLFMIALFSVFVIAIDGLVQYYYSYCDGLHNYPSFKFRLPHEYQGFFRGFPTASFPFPNDFAAWMLLCIFPLGCVTVFGLAKSNMKYVTATAFLAISYLFFLTKARGAWTGFAVAIVYIAISKRKLWLIILLIIVASIPFLLKMEMSHYIFETSSVGDRFSMWGTSGEILNKHPIIGNGINTFFENFRRYRNDEWKGQKGSYAHNCYLQMACDVGIIGLGAFMLIMGAYFVSVVKSLKKIDDRFFNSILWGLSIGVFAFLIHSAFDTNLYSLNLATLFWTAIGISQSIIIVFKKVAPAQL